MSDVATGPDARALFRLIYRSRNRIPRERRKVALGALFSGARAKNKGNDITGALLVHDDWFVQTLEGEESTVRSLYETIAKDSRHDSLSVLEAKPVDDRVFSRWSMAEVAEQLGEPDVFLITHKGQISPAASLRTTSEQEEVLDGMRAAARGVPQLPRPMAAKPESDAERRRRVGSPNMA